MICIGCGCTEDRACLVNGEPCSWAATSDQLGIGLCSACVGIPIEQLVALMALAQRSQRVRPARMAVGA